MATETKVHTWPYTTDTDPRLFTDLQGGRIACRRHLGGYGTTMLNAYPYGESFRGRIVWMTPLDTWTVMEADERKEFVKDMAEFGMPDARPICEDCKYDPDDPEQRDARVTYEAEVEDE